MTSSNLVLTLTLLAVTSCLTLAKPLSGNDKQLLSILSSYYKDSDLSDAFNDNNEDNMADNPVVRSLDDDLTLYSALDESNLLQGQGRDRRFQPTIRDLYSAGIVRDNTRFMGGKMKRQPHLGFHASRG